MVLMMPMKMLEESVNKRVSLLLKDNRVLEGVLTGFDEYMNMVLDDVDENSENVSRKLGTVVVRGSNVVRIVPK
ncbi:MULTISPECIES: LSM domain-containing protein [Thermoplasma]|nr:MULTISPECIES: LSM domain-containing protein [Thermoplasma]